MLNHALSETKNYIIDQLSEIRKLSDKCISHLSASTSCGIPYTGGIGRIYGSSNWIVIHERYGFTIEPKCDDYEYESLCSFEIHGIREYSEKGNYLDKDYIYVATAYSLVEAIAFIYQAVCKIDRTKSELSL